MRRTNARWSPSSLSSVVKGGFWLYLVSLTNNVSGFVFWLIVSVIAGPTVIGYVSAVVSLASLLTGLLSFGVNRGLIRWVGECAGKGDLEGVRAYFWSSFLLLALSSSSPATALILLSLRGLSFYNYTPSTLLFVAVLLLLNMASAFPSLFIGLMDTFPYFVANFIGCALKILIGVYLIWLGLGWKGALIGYLMVRLSLMGIGVFFLARRVGLRPAFSLNHLLEVLKAGLPSWLPGIVLLIGQQLAVIFVFNLVGVVESGIFYVAMAVSSFIVGIAGSVQQMMMPFLSGLGDGRKRAAWKGLKVSVALTAPLIAGVSLFPDFILGLLGPQYRAGGILLDIVMASNVISLLSATVMNLCYAYKLFRPILYVGLATSMFRLTLYVFLTPALGAVGVAISLLAGSACGLLASLAVARRVGFKFDGRALCLIVLIPLGIGLAVGGAFRILIPKLWPLGLASVALLGFAALMRARLIERGEVREIGAALIPKTLQPRVYGLGKELLDLIYGEGA